LWYNSIDGDDGVYRYYHILLSYINIDGRITMKKQRNDYRPCSDLDIRAAALRATHEKLREMDAEGKPTVGMFGDVLREERAKLRAYGEHMAKQGTCPVMTWDELKKAVNKFAEGDK
jgi:hypothetical protein